jgi:raffinose/stachyose/melibiose transport system permease protein
VETRTVRTSELVDKKGSAPRLKRLAGRSGKPGARKAPPGEPRKVAYLYILPALLFYSAFVLLPIVHSVWLSFFEWDGITVGTWVGLGNYLDILFDRSLRAAFVHAVVLIFFYSFVPVVVGLLLAAAMSRSKIRGLALFRTVLFLPQVIAMVVIAVVWRLIYAPEGPLNEGLRLLGLDSLTQAWLGGFTTALPALGMVGAWVQFGLCMVLFLAGIQKIPPDLYDAAKVDGAGPLREFFTVTLPGLRAELAVGLTLTMISALRTFDLIYITTRGGPGDATNVPALEVYERAFLTGQVGSAAALGIMLALVIFALSFATIRLGEGRKA